MLKPGSDNRFIVGILNDLVDRIKIDSIRQARPVRIIVSQVPDDSFSQAIKESLEY